MQKQATVEFDGKEVVISGSVASDSQVPMFEGPHGLESVEISVKDGVLSFRFTIQQAPPPPKASEVADEAPAPESEEAVPTEPGDAGEEAPAKPAGRKKK